MLVHIDIVPNSMLLMFDKPIGIPAWGFCENGLTVQEYEAKSGRILLPEMELSWAGGSPRGAAEYFIWMLQEKMRIVGCSRTGTYILAVRPLFCLLEGTTRRWVLNFGLGWYAGVDLGASEWKPRASQIPMEWVGEESVSKVQAGAFG